MNATKRKQFDIDKKQVVEAYKSVKANAGAAGIDRITLELFEKDLKRNLYRIWNRMSSGSYFPPPVLAVPIPKKTGGHRILGVPTVADRVAQTVVKLSVEPSLEKVFLPDSYGYRPGRSAHDAIGVTRERCWKYDWLLEFDIKGLFDNIDHELLMKAVRKHVQDKWALLYIERWIKAPMQLEDGTEVPRTAGTPQGGVISPLLANLFLHYCFDIWMRRFWPALPWCRFADDAVIHCRTQREAEAVKGWLQRRLRECKLQMHPDKTKIVYCKDERRKGAYPNQSFDFLGFTFRPRTVWNSKQNRIGIAFTPAVSRSSMKSMRQKIRDMNFRRSSEIELTKIAETLNPALRGWIQYYGRFGATAMDDLYKYVDMIIVRWARRKFRLRSSKTQTRQLFNKLKGQNPRLFAHWSRIKRPSVHLVGAV